MYDSIFSICGALAMVGWLGLVLLPGKPWVVEIIARWLIPGAIGVVYLFLMATHIDATPEGGGFDSLAAVSTLFSVDGLLLAGWIHYLAFDLLVGSWEVSDARKRGVAHWLVVPCLAATLMAGPGGLVLYLVVRTGWRLWRGTPAEAQVA